jgi:hypothetical protein
MKRSSERPARCWLRQNLVGHMRPAQDYHGKAARAERLADDPRQQPELRAELRAVARQWRHRAELTDWLARQSG